MTDTELLEAIEQHHLGINFDESFGQWHISIDRCNGQGEVSLGEGDSNLRRALEVAIKRL